MIRTCASHTGAVAFGLHFIKKAAYLDVHPRGLERLTMMLIQWFAPAGCLLIFLLALLVFVRSTLVVVTVESRSMSPTLEHGDRVLAWRYWPSSWLRRGQIVLVWPWISPSIGPTSLGKPGFVPYIKRVAALPGDALITSLTDLAERHRSQVLAEHDITGRRVWNIPPGHLFVRGDNTLGGIDSLTWGPIPFESVVGLVILRLPRRELHDQANMVRYTIRKEGFPVGEDAPEFTAETLQGKQVTKTTYVGRSVAFIFISRSDSCREIISACEALHPHAHLAGVELVLVGTGNSEETRAIIAESRTTLPVLNAPQATNPFMRDYNFNTTPSYCLIDELGKVRSAGYPSPEWGGWKALAESWQGSKATEKLVVPIARRPNVSSQAPGSTQDRVGL